jgi:drug/metabolite transporter (DMT)-like permease
MVAAPVLWSTAGVVTRHVERASAFEQVFWRSLFAFVFVLGFLLFRKSNPWRAVRAGGWPGLVSGLMWTVMFTAFMFALAMTTTANALVVMSISPLLTAVFARIFLSDAVPPRTWIASCAAAIGISFMFGFSLEKHFLGMAIALLIPFAAAINVVVLRASAAKLDLVPAVMVGGALSCLFAFVFSSDFSATPRDVALLAFLGFFQLGLPCTLLVIASRTLPAPEIALLALLEVVLGPLWAWLGAGETPGTATLAGGMVVLGALALNEAGALRRSR